uniref:Uncharacterized protein n=1 Tax=Arundo donax TaxID=35708 RepID=A0A0A9CDI9_ARUDO
MDVNERRGQLILRGAALVVVVVVVVTAWLFVQLKRRCLPDLV